MLQKFSKGHEYKFSKEQTKKDFGEEHFENCIDNNIAFKEAIEYCEGKCVELKSETTGWINDETNAEYKYQVAPQWCICVGRNDYGR